MGFADSVKKNVDRVKRELNNKTYAIAYQLFVTVVKLTPNNTTYSRGNMINDWHVAFNSFSTAKYSAVDAQGNSTTNANSDSSGSGSLSRISSMMPNMFYGKDGFVSLTNNSHYAMRVEKIGWPTEQSTGGWVWTGNAQRGYHMVSIALSTTAAKHR